jgi:hypothetical protein
MEADAGREKRRFSKYRKRSHAASSDASGDVDATAVSTEQKHEEGLLLLRRVCEEHIVRLSSHDGGCKLAALCSGAKLTSCSANCAAAEVLRWRHQAALIVKNEELSCWRALHAWIKQHL